MKYKKAIVLFSILFNFVFAYAIEQNVKTVMSFDIEKKEVVQKKYDYIKEYYAYPVEITLDNGIDLRFASILPVYTVEKGWIRSQFLEKGDKVFYLGEDGVIPISIKKSIMHKVMNVFYTYVNVEDTHNYFKENILVHNYIWEHSDHYPYVPPEKDNNGGSSSSSGGDNSSESGSLSEGSDSGTDDESDSSSETDGETKPRRESRSSKARKLAQAVTKFLAGIKNHFESVVRSIITIFARNERNQNESNVQNAALNAQQVGDPVLATTGVYIHEEIDLELTGNISSIEISRLYTSTNDSVYAMGRSWASILDSKIIRGITSGLDTLNHNIPIQILELQKQQSALSSYSTYDTAKKAIEEVQAQIEEMNRVYSEVHFEIELSRTLQSLNAYVVGPHTKESHYSIGNNNLTYIDEKGSPVVFKYVANGEWIPIDSKRAQYMRIKSIDGKDALTEKGFILYTKEGKEIWFDKWGLLEKFVDKNDNEVLFMRDIEGKITKIITPEKREIGFLYYDSGFIKTITNHDKKMIEYTYIGNNLSSVKDIDGNTFSFIYDSNGYLAQIEKPDGSTVNITYELQNKNKDYLTTSTTNEEGFSEYFEYDLENNLTVYKSHTGLKEYIYYDDLHRTIKEIDSKGNTTLYTYDDIGNLHSRTYNGTATMFAYDDRGNKIQELYSDGSKKTWVYNEFDKVTRYTDRDGKTWSIMYDLRGNAIEYRSSTSLIERAQYDVLGNIIRLENYKGDITQFMYDASFNVISITRGNIVERFDYDELGNIVKYIDGENRVWSYTYEDKKITQVNPYGLKREFVFDNRKDIVSVRETDTHTNEERRYNYEYDNRHQLLALYQNDKEIMRYSYYPSGEVNTITYGQYGLEKSWRMVYELFNDRSGYSIYREMFSEDGNSLSRAFIESYEEKVHPNSIIQNISLGRQKIYNFDAWDRLISIENTIGEKISTVLSPEGRVLKEQIDFGGWYEYTYDEQGFLRFASEKGAKGVEFSYNSDGSLASTTDQNDNKTWYEYNSLGLLSQERQDNINRYYMYDNVGRPTSIVIGNNSNLHNSERFILIEYSPDSRRITIDYGGVYTETLVINAWGDIVKTIDGLGNVFTNEYNSLGQKIKTIDAYNSETVYTYNALGFVTHIQNPDLTEEFYEYNVLGHLEKISDSLGLEWKGEFDEDGRLIKEWNRGSTEKTYTYDMLDRITSVSIAGVEIEQYSYGPYSQSLTFRDGKNHDYMYTRDTFGRIVQEKNRLGDYQYYNYDSMGRLVQKVDFNTNSQFIHHSKNGKENTVEYADGSIFSFMYNSTGQTVAAANITGEIQFTFNKAGFLERQYDEKANETTYYSYDKAGRRSRYTSLDRNVLYTYGKNGELLRVEDDSQRLSVSYSYDVMMREIKRVFANGISQTRQYDKAGRTILITEKDSRGEIIRSEGYVYDDDGKITFKCDENALVTKYLYDMQGRLHTILYPYTEEKVQADKQEAIEQGLFLMNDMNRGETLNLSSSDMQNISKVLNMINHSRSNLLRSVQTVWKESYSYDENSNRKTKTTSWGTITYVYDNENRLIHSGEENRGTAFKYDANGNLVEKNNAYSNEIYLYNHINRMRQSIISDTEQKIYTTTHYAYDAFGRRNLVQNEGFSQIRTLFDGQSHDIIRETQVFESGVSANSFFKTEGQTYSPSNASSDRYVFVEERELEHEYADQERWETQQTRFAGTKIPLYAKGESVGMKYIDSLNSKQETLYYGTDILGSIKSTTNEYASVKQRYEYDAFGMPYKGNLITGLHSGYTGKPFDAQTHLYNYGFRDYSPSQARFTTVDPIRDGNNWFSYVVNDPVNFIDKWGLYIVSTEGSFKQQDFGLVQYLGNSTDFAVLSGCLVVAVADGAAELKNNALITAVSINNNHNNFTADKSGYMNVKATVENLGLEHDYWTKEVQGNLKDKINEANNSDYTYSIVARVPRNANGDQHWVTVQGGTIIRTDGIEYVPVKGTSENDYTRSLRPSSWKYGEVGTAEEGLIFIPVSYIEKIHTIQGDKKND